MIPGRGWSDPREEKGGVGVIPGWGGRGVIPGRGRSGFREGEE